MKDLAGSTLYYAPGGGLGHMRRAHWVAKQLGFAHDWTLIASPAPHLQAWMADRTRVERIPSALENRRTDLQAWLRDIVDRVRPQRIFVDAFPGGLFGEWCGLDLPPDIEQIHVARLLVWSNYCGRLCEPSPRFDRIYILEPLHQEHEKALNRMSSSVGPLVLEPFVADSETAPPVSSPFWLITHSEPVEEVLELLAHAREEAPLEGEAHRLVAGADRQREQERQERGHAEEQHGGGGRVGVPAQRKVPARVEGGAAQHDRHRVFQAGEPTGNDAERK